VVKIEQVITTELYLMNVFLPERILSLELPPEVFQCRGDDLLKLKLLGEGSKRPLSKPMVKGPFVLYTTITPTSPIV
jgi:hypothetical protein